MKTSETPAAPRPIDWEDCLRKSQVALEAVVTASNDQFTVSELRTLAYIALDYIERLDKALYEDAHEPLHGEDDTEVDTSQQQPLT